MKKKVALLAGGYSGEYVISIKTAATIEKHIDSEKYNVYKIIINRDKWEYHANGQTFPVDKNDFSIIINGQKIIFDIAFIAIHGTPGEDGKLQGYLDMLQIPYTTCGAATSAVTFNKRYTVAVAHMAGITVAKSVLLVKNNFDNPEEVAAHLGFPVFVKPNNGGSSISTTKVNKASDELGAAIEKAFQADDQVLVEEFISGREFTIGAYKKDNKLILLPITEIISKKEFFDFEAKYEGASNEITPAEITADIAKKINEAAQKAYKAFNCSGLVRIDFIYDEDSGQPFMLEVNTVPGQSEASIVPQQVRAAGMDLRTFYDILLTEALDR